MSPELVEFHAARVHAQRVAPQAAPVRTRMGVIDPTADGDLAAERWVDVRSECR